MPIDDLEPINSTEKNCILCQCPLDTKVNLNATSSAISDLNFSKLISKLEPNNNNIPDETDIDFSKYCYSCSVILNDTVSLLYSH